MWGCGDVGWYGGVLREGGFGLFDIILERVAL